MGHLPSGTYALGSSVRLQFLKATIQTRFIKMSLLTPLYAAVFAQLEKRISSSEKNNLELLHSPDSDSKRGNRFEKYLWIYASTIGELNAVSVLIDALIAKDISLGLVILTDHPHYVKAFHSKYDKAIVLYHGQTASDVKSYFRKYPPSLLLIAEIPCFMFDAPCRLAFKVLRECKNNGGRVAVVNGWLYDQRPTCRMDALENYLFGSAYQKLVDCYLMQRESDKAELVSHGVNENKIFVTGNLKFDAVQLTQPDDALKAGLIGGANRHILVCGCVTNVSEQEMIIEAFKDLLDSHPDVLLVLAPRHPENASRMKILGDILDKYALSSQLRSQQMGMLDKNVNVLVLNTMGELHRFYGIGDVCYVGLNHNILEPISYLKPVVITSGWDKKYPSYPVYHALRDDAAIKHLEPDVREISRAFSEILSAKSLSTSSSIKELIQKLSGALAIAIEHLNRLVDQNR